MSGVRGPQLAGWGRAAGGSADPLAPSLGSFMSTADRVRLPDDCTVGYIVEGLLGARLLRSSLFHSHLENLRRLPPATLAHQVPPRALAWAGVPSWGPGPTPPRCPRGLAPPPPRCLRGLASKGSQLSKGSGTVGPSVDPGLGLLGPGFSLTWGLVCKRRQFCCPRQAGRGRLDSEQWSGW